MADRARSHLNVMREALRLMRIRHSQLHLNTRHPERTFWWHMANEWENKILTYESWNKRTPIHPQLGHKVLLPGSGTPYYYMSKSIIRMLRPHEPLDSQDSA